ncbi:MAG: hypothetical protein SCARUB_03409 [Candidatus Scalindua rubra]|uniref:AAA+ ATPase domain-containing protein n=1 Tax=Candidatus Scalindua rubra TaxID=1872076 RepID=A0A1E3X762_9BACT|nr:MAG: hypothetical protein SCARUB_03409 [Candidatus Scalindua rubra]
MLITGEVGTGKTILCRTLLHRYRSRLENNIKTALILNPSYSDRQLLQLIIKDFGIQGNFKSKFDLINALNEFLLEETSRGHNVVLIIDEAQNLVVKQLEQVRLLSNFETEKEKLLQIILIGQPELCEKLELPSLRQLNQRIVVRYHLLPLKRDEAENYIKHRLKIASSENSENMVRFTNKAIDTIYESCKGTPRMINIICDRALLAGYTLETFTIDEHTIHKCVQEIDKKINGRLHGLQNREEDIKPRQTLINSSKNKKPWYKNFHVLLCIFLIIAGIPIVIISNFSDRLSVLSKLKPSDQKNIPVQPNLQNQPSVQTQKNTVPTKSDQSKLVIESKERINELYNKGHSYDKQGNYKEAIKWYRKAAEQGHARAQAILGIMYSQGQGVEQDFKEAVRWYQKAAEQGIDYAKEALKRLERNNPDDNFLIDLQKPIN